MITSCLVATYLRIAGTEEILILLRQRDRKAVVRVFLDFDPLDLKTC